MQFIMQKDPEQIIEQVKKENRCFELELIEVNNKPKLIEVNNKPIIYNSEKLKIGTKIYFFGGINPKGEITNQISVYDISQEEFNIINSPLPEKLYYFSITHDESNNNKLYILGGYKDKYEENHNIYSLELKDNKCI